MNTPAPSIGNVASFVAGALLSGSFATFAAAGPSSLGLPAGFGIQADDVAAKSEHSGANIQRMRNEAASGDDLANEQLSVAMLERHDASDSAEDLNEVLFWADRHGDAFANPRFVARVVTNYCSQRMARWHWYCVLGE